MLAVGLHEMNARERPKLLPKGYVNIHTFTYKQSIKKNCPIAFLSACTQVHLDEDNLVLIFFFYLNLGFEFLLAK